MLEINIYFIFYFSESITHDACCIYNSMLLIYVDECDFDEENISNIPYLNVTSLDDILMSSSFSFLYFFFFLLS